MERIPIPPVLNRPHVLKVRLLTSLGVRSCYALRCNGTLGLFQVQLPKKAEEVGSRTGAKPFLVRQKRARQKVEMPWLPFAELPAASF